MTEQLFKVGAKVPQAGRYECLACGLFLEFLTKHIEKGVVFTSCPVCFAGTDKGTKKATDDIWKLHA